MMLLLSAGTPMMTGGDEQLRTLRCNNNPYNLDSEKNWLAAQRTPDEEQFRRFTQRVLAFRAAHPALRPGAFWRGADGNGNGLEQARWFQPNGSTADQAYLEQVNNHAVGLRVDSTELGERELIFLAINGWTGGVTFTLPSAGAGRSWHLAGDSCAANEGPDQFAPVGQERAITSGTVTVCARGVAVFVGR
jgi:glycogen operon protein